MRTPEEREKHTAYMREWRAKNKDKVAQSKAKSYAKNPQPARDRAARSYRRDPERSKEYRRNYYQQNKERWKEQAKKVDPAKRRRYHQTHRLKKFGLTFEEYDALLIAQSGLCAICNDQMTEDHIDHCHTTNKVRGLLCGLCNRALGGFRDDPQILAAAIEYLNQ